jgi:FkbM family methyltransferase
MNVISNTIATRSSQSLGLGGFLRRARRAIASINPLHVIARVVFGRLLPRWPYPVLRGPLRGYRFILGALAGEAGGVSVHLGLLEVDQVECLTQTLQRGRIFFDVGANVGFYSLLGSKLVGSDGAVVAFEPMPRNLAFLFQHTRLNKARNVTIAPLACADEISAELFVEGENNALGRLGGHDVDLTSAAARAIVVATISLDAAAEKLSLRPDVIKIDVEGAELRVLKGAKNILMQARPSVLLSVHSAELRDACLAYLDALQYQSQPLNAKSVELATEFFAKPIT